MLVLAASLGSLAGGYSDTTMRRGLEVRLGALSDPCERYEMDCDIQDPGLVLTAAQTRALALEWPNEEDTGPEASSWYEFGWYIDCEGNSLSNPDQNLCDLAWEGCESMPGSGYYSRVYRREVHLDGTSTSWQYHGHTCWPASVPDRSGDIDALTVDEIIEQFHQTEFAPPVLSSQPPDGQALVHLPVYFEVGWGEGYAPGSIDTTSILGFDVRIRPVLVDVTYHFGDGATEGPTNSMGGVYPTGDVTHTYQSALSADTYAIVTYGGEVSIDGSDWELIPATAMVAGPVNDISVRTSTNRLQGESTG